MGPKLKVVLLALIAVAMVWGGSHLLPQHQVLLNGKIYTVSAERRWAEAVEIRDGRIATVGTTEDVSQSIGWLTDVVDLEGRMVMPGIHDAHMHLLIGAVKNDLQCKLSDGINVDQMVVELKQCVADGKMTEDWLIASSYAPSSFPGSKPNKDALDAAFPDTPVYISDYSIHNGLVNSRGLEMLGLDASSEDPVAGYYDRDLETGELTGLLVERAQSVAQEQLPLPSAIDLFMAIDRAIKKMNQAGITSFQEAVGIGPATQLLNAMDTLGFITLGIDIHWAQGLKGLPFGDEATQTEWLEDRAEYASENIYTDSVKFLMDGVPLPPKPTHSALDPVTGLPDATMLIVSEDELFERLRELDLMGVRAKMHAAGQGAIRAVLNAVDRVREANGDTGVSHDLAHAGTTHPDDRLRPAQNGTVIEFSPSFWADEDLIPSGDGNDINWWFKTAVESGAVVTAGSDWPVVSDFNHFKSIEGMMNVGDQSIDLASAIEVFTINGAKAVGREASEGSIEVGKWANLIVLDRNLFDISPTDIGDTQVLQTFYKGEPVFSAN